MTAHHRRARWSHIDENEDHSDRHVGGGDGSRVLIVDRFDRAARHIDRAGDLVGDHHGDGSNLAAAGAPSARTELGGTLGSENTCEIHTESPGYTVDIRFPIDYPEQQSLTDFLTQHRDGFVDWVAEAPPRSFPYELTDLGVHDHHRDGRVPLRRVGHGAAVVTLQLPGSVHAAPRRG